MLPIHVFSYRIALLLFQICYGNLTACFESEMDRTRDCNCPETCLDTKYTASVNTYQDLLCTRAFSQPSEGELAAATAKVPQ